MGFEVRLFYKLDAETNSVKALKDGKKQNGNKQKTK